MQNNPPPDICAIERPSPKLLNYYFLVSLLAGPFFPIAFVPLFFKYQTMRYRFDSEGISMRWGILFRREIILNYARIQDIHLSSNVVERWLGLAKIEIQTAAGGASAEMTIEGVLEFEQVRDFLYANMRGTRDAARTAPARSGAAEGSTAAAELTQALRSVAEELKAVRIALERPPPAGDRSST